MIVTWPSFKYCKRKTCRITFIKKVKIISSWFKKLFSVINWFLEIIIIAAYSQLALTHQNQWLRLVVHIFLHHFSEVAYKAMFDRVVFCLQPHKNLLCHNLTAAPQMGLSYFCMCWFHLSNFQTHDNTKKKKNTFPDLINVRI